MTYEPGWQSALWSASFDGFPFTATKHRTTLGRQLAIKEYPYYDNVVIEDMGLGQQIFEVQGYLSGDASATEANAFELLMAVGGAGLLMHPARGPVFCQPIASTISNVGGGVFELTLTVILNIKNPLTSALGLGYIATLAISTVLNGVLDAIIGVFSGSGGGSGGNAPAVNAVGVVCSQFCAAATASKTNAQAVAGGVTGLGVVLAGSNSTLGRFDGGNLSPQYVAAVLAPLAASSSAITAISAGSIALLAAATASRTLVSSDVVVVIQQAGLSTPATLVAAVQVLIVDLVATIADPADQINLLAALASFQPELSTGASAVAQEIQAAQAATGAMLRRISLCALATASGQYAPTSSTQALAILSLIAPLFDSEILHAADAGDLEVYQQLRSLRAATVTDLQTRAIALPNLITLNLPIVTPLVRLAYELYQDATRVDDLLQRNGTLWHPLFSCLNIEALSS